MHAREAQSAAETIVGTTTGLPPGITAGIGGGAVNFTGTPTATGIYSGSVTIQDSATAQATKTFTITIAAVPTIGNLTQSGWDLNHDGFPGTMTISGGTLPDTLVGSVAVPTGMAVVVNGSTISFTGTPTSPGTFNGSLTIQDAASARASQAFTISINSAPTIGDLTTTAWTVNQGAFPGTMAITGGTDVA